jgi:hypothetical protein
MEQSRLPFHVYCTFQIIQNSAASVAGEEFGRHPSHGSISHLIELVIYVQGRR